MVPNRSSISAAKPSAAQVKLIEDLGGTRAVAEIVNAALFVGILPNAVAMWRLRGIPYFYHDTLKAAATDRGLEVPSEFIGR